MGLRKQFENYIDSLRVTPGKKISLQKHFRTDHDQKLVTKEEGLQLMENGIKNMAILQDKLYAHDEYSVLIVLQAMDAAGKDSAIKHVMSGLNPSGVKVYSFKVPSKEELDHDYIWRHYKALPARGEIGIFNRSHYENVLVTRVHPEYILNERIPGISSLKDIKPSFWKSRYDQINRFEKNLAENGTIILKFFLHVSKEEQLKRFIDRIDDPTKNWKFSYADTQERQHWDSYMQAYEEMLAATSTSHAPWYVLPADDKWFTRLCLGAAMFFEFEKLKLDYPKVSDTQKAELLRAKEELLAAEGKKSNGRGKKKR
ncbi:MAG: polyphosphate kinase 2 family protein [Chitinophagaceae bacterium]|jgi:PPK2 family polyphosphate:nucleotide phosphotransferase|nr:polyphosphate kinase 2 family protein [Chitinophagaceae bacterium]